MMAFWVYILRCADASFYTGHTDNIEQRIAQHNTGAIPTCYTFTRRPLSLVFTQDFATRGEAIVAEQQIKGWSRMKKEAMIEGDWAEVSRLAMNHQSARPAPRSEADADTITVRPELVVGKDHTPVRPELVEGRTVHGSTGSPRTDLSRLAHHERTLPCA